MAVTAIALIGSEVIASVFLAMDVIALRMTFSSRSPAPIGNTGSRLSTPFSEQQGLRHHVLRYAQTLRVTVGRQSKFPCHHEIGAEPELALLKASLQRASSTGDELFYKRGTSS
jgi:hypothetical protein